MIDRRRFLMALAGASAATAGCRTLDGERRDEPGDRSRLLFTSRGKTGLVDADGGGLRYLEFDVPGQATWQPAGFFPDGRVLFLSMEPRRDGPGKPFAEYYHRTPTHIWIHDLDRGSLTEIATRERRSVFYTPMLLLGNGRLLVQVVRDDGIGQALAMNLDGTGAKEFTRPGEGLPYGLALGPDGRRVAYHLASPVGYQIWTSDAEGGNRTLVAGHSDHLYFGPTWSPDGGWLAYQDCLHRQDPGHDWSDIRLSRPDGSEGRLLTEGQAMWFGTTYGDPRTRGGGSSRVAWTPGGSILFPRRLPGSKVPWEYQAGRPDTDHFNRDFRPDLARGGTEICRLDPRDRSAERLTRSDPPVWDFRPTPSPDGRRIAFCRAETGKPPALWVMDADGRGARRLTAGLDGDGADAPQWLPSPGPDRTQRQAANSSHPRGSTVGSNPQDWKGAGGGTPPRKR